MLTQEEILKSIKYVVDNANFVHIKKENIFETISNLKDFAKYWLSPDKLGINKLNEQDKIKYLIIGESLNFCFWDTPIKWKIEYNEE